MAKFILRTGKTSRPKTAVKGKRFLCAKCRKRSPKPVKSPAPWYCPIYLNQSQPEPAAKCMGDEGKSKSHLGREALA